MSELTTQKNVDLKLTTTLGDDKLIADEVTIDEYLHGLFDIKIIAHSTDINLDLNAALGKTMTVSLNINKEKRYFSGIVARFEQIHTTILDAKKELIAFYQIRLVPKVWLLTHTKDFRIFQNKSVQEIIQKLLGEAKVTDFSYKSKKGTSKKREFCVQYNESNFDFIVRLCEEEGVFFNFEHTSSTHKVNFVDALTVPEKLDSFPYAQKSPSSLPMNQIFEFLSSEQVTGTKFKVVDYNYLTPTVALEAEAEGKGLGGEYYDYPGLFQDKGDGTTIAKDRLASQNWGAKAIQGSSSIPMLTPYKSFKMTNHPRSSLNQEYIIFRVRHKVSQARLDENVEGLDRLYENQFWAYPATETYIPPRTKEKKRVASLQTATVTGPKGEEIFTDKYGRVKVKFHWDTRNEADDKSSCWIRVAQNWAGSQWGGVVIPRIGMEVVVSFIDGDPDRPLVIGCVYNGEKLPPYTASEPTKSTFKTSSSKGDKGNNELRFEDKADKEEIYIHAQKDMNVVIESDRTEKILKKNDILTIEKGNKTEELKGVGTKYKVDITDGDRELTITKGNHKITLNKGDQTIDLKKGDQKVTLTMGNSEMTLTQGNAKITLASGNLEITVTGNTKIVSTGNIDIVATGKLGMIGTGGVMIQSGANIMCQASANMQVVAGANLQMAASANLIANAGANMTLVSGANAVVNGGANIVLNAGANAVMNSAATMTFKGEVVSVAATAYTVAAKAAVTLQGAMVKLN